LAIERINVCYIVNNREAPIRHGLGGTFPLCNKLAVVIPQYLRLTFFQGVSTNPDRGEKTNSYKLALTAAGWFTYGVGIRKAFDTVAVLRVRHVRYASAGLVESQSELYESKS
jgi:hypothetical protein